jgi:hypothetical protein
VEQQHRTEADGASAVVGLLLTELHDWDLQRNGQSGRG